MSTSPANSATLVAPSANVTAPFSEAMDASTYRRGSEHHQRHHLQAGQAQRGRHHHHVTSTVRYAAATKKAILDPASNLRSGRTYKATVTSGAQTWWATRSIRTPT